MLNKVMRLVLKLEEKVAYAIPPPPNAPLQSLHLDQPMWLSIM